MKKKLIFWALVVACVVLTGCVKSEANFTINKNKSMDLSITYLISDQLLSLSDSSEDESTTTDVKEGSDTWKSLQERGYIVSKLVEDDYTGFKVKRHFDNIDDIATSEDISIKLSDFLDKKLFDDKKFFKVQKGIFKNVYTGNFTYDLTDEENNNQNEDEIDLSAYTSSIIFKYTVTLPKKALSNNAVGVSDDELTYTWKIPYGKVTTINYSFEMVNFNAYIAVTVATMLFVLIIALAIFLVLKNKRKNK